MIEDKELGIKIGTEKEAKWNEVLKNSKANELQAQIDSEIYHHLIKLAEKKLKQENDKLK